MRIPRGAITKVAVAREVMASLRHEVLEELAVELRRPVGYSTRPRFICWAERSGRIEYARCWPYLSPATWDPVRPLIVRVSINLGSPDRLDIVADRAGLTSRGGAGTDAESKRWFFELSMLPHEAVSFVPFLGGLVTAHEAQNAGLLLEPPTATRFWQAEPLVRNYAWTEAAWEAIETYNQQSPLHLRARPRDAALHALNRAERRA
jgi:hypothetical protein